MTQVDLHHGANTDVGHVRKVNEDSMLVAPPVFVVADGMGGHSGGDVASRIVVEEFASLSRSGLSRSGPAGSGLVGEGLPEEGSEVRAQEHVQGQVQDALARAQSRILSYAEGQRTDHPRWHSGTTCAAALVIDDAVQPHWLLVNLGDSRIYAFHDAELTRVSTDHSVVQELLDAGTITAAEAEIHPERHVITRALGSGSQVRADFFRVPLAQAARILLCTDGVSGMIDEDTISALLRQHENPGECADQLVRAALDAGGRDNATAIVIDVVGLRHEDSYDSANQMASLEDKLGARP